MLTTLVKLDKNFMHVYEFQNLGKPINHLQINTMIMRVIQQKTFHDKAHVKKTIVIIKEKFNNIELHFCLAVGK